MTIKMRDIAKDLGVSVITVSKVLRNHPEVGHATRERVLARVKELDYRPNLAARSLVTGRTYLVGLIVPDLLHPFFAEVAKSLSDVLRKSGYYLIISSSEEDPDLEQQEVDHLLARQLDTLVIASCRPTAELFVRIERHKTPYILIDRSVPGASANYVGVDDVAVGRLATEHLIAIGCKRIAHIRGPETSPGVARLEGYKRALLRGESRSTAVTSRPCERSTSIRNAEVRKRWRSSSGSRQNPTASSATTIHWRRERWTMPSNTERGFRRTWRSSDAAICTMTIRCGSVCPASINTADGSVKSPRAWRSGFSARGCPDPLKR